MKEIQLNQGYVALVDDDDFEELSKYKWSICRGGKNKDKLYAVAHIMMSRLIIGEYDNTKKVDHINGNGLDNRKHNLRSCTQMQNTWNTPKIRSRITSSRFKGVSWNKKNNKWAANIRIDNKLKHLGYFTSEVDAAIAYNSSAQKYRGEYAVLNKLENII